MNKRVTLLKVILLGVLLVVVAFAAAACGSADETTTTAAPTTTTAAASTATTAAGSMTVPSLTPELTAYLTQMQTLFAGLDALPETSDPMAVTDISKVTDADIKAYETALDQMKTALKGLKDLKPPAEIAAFQDALVKGIESSIDIAGKAIDALKDKDQAAFDAAKADADALDAEMETILEQLVPLMMGGTATS